MELFCILFVGLAPQLSVSHRTPAALNTKGWILLYVNFTLIKTEKELYRGFSKGFVDSIEA